MTLEQTLNKPGFEDSSFKEPYICDIKINNQCSEDQKLGMFNISAGLVVTNSISIGTEESSYYGGIALKLLVSQGKCDLQICDLPCCHALDSSYQSSHQI
nr:BV-like protein [Cotesia vestalis bracovirus]